MPATRAADAGIARRYGNQSIAIPPQRVIQLPTEFEPATVENRLIQPRLALALGITYPERVASALDMADTCKSSTNATAWFLLIGVEILSKTIGIPAPLCQKRDELHAIQQLPAFPVALILER